MEDPRRIVGAEGLRVARMPEGPHAGQSARPTSTSTYSSPVSFSRLPASETATPMASSTVSTSLTSQAASIATR